MKKTHLKYLFFIIIICILTIFIYLNNRILNEEKVIYQYDNEKPNEYYVPKVDFGKEIQINFDCCFKDLVQIYVNDKLIDISYLKTDESTSFTEHTLKVKFDKGKKTTLKIVLPFKKVYCKYNTPQN